MSQISVTIAGRVFRMACEDGQEPHLTGLAAALDKRIADMREQFGEIGDQRLTVMAAISFADEQAEAVQRTLALEDELSSLRESALGASALAEETSQHVAKAIDEAATRIEAIVRVMDGAKP